MKYRVFNCRLTDAEMEQINALIAESGMSKAEWVRERLIGKGEVVCVTHRQDTT